MSSITNELCNKILTNYFGHNNYNIVSFNAESASKDAFGFLSTTSVLKINVSVDNNVKEVRFFIKFLPDTEYQLSLVKTANCFKKEAVFFGELFSGMREFLSHKSIPNCYLKENESMIVFEDLNVDGYKTCSAYDIDLKHTYAAIKALADIHSASLLYEHKIGKKLDEVFPEEILRPWFSEIDGYSGYRENLAAAKIIGIIIDKYFQNYSENIMNKAKTLLLKYSSFVQNKSKKYCNAISHFDLWCNNMMFKYNQNGCVENCVIIDFQTYGYNTPALDLLTLLYCNLERSKRAENMQNFLDYYYKCSSENIKNHSVNPDDLLKKEDFMASVDETLPLAITGAAIFLHSAILPEIELLPVASDVKRMEEYFEFDRTIVLEIMEKYENYRIRVLQSVEDLLEVIKKSL